MCLVLHCFVSLLEVLTHTAAIAKRNCYLNFIVFYGFVYNLSTKLKFDCAVSDQSKHSLIESISQITLES